MIRAQGVILRLLRDALPSVEVYSWLPDVDRRGFPLLLVSRRGGVRNPSRPDLLDVPLFDLLAVSADGMAEAEDLYSDALEALYAAVKAQTVVVDVGYLHSIRETRGASQGPSPCMDTWAVDGTVRLGVRPDR